LPGSVEEQQMQRRAFLQGGGSTIMLAAICFSRPRACCSRKSPRRPKQS
jgi:hypothetical protein